ncbi:hypothetical protein NC653_018288 [Populus alba x Populus x berolinensis]|uniref:Retrovirus-related Pol polyprotein from transposon TNT 1-94 n=1 Tax=Populus alba x Populus x berolinensis TaxID=444605 RepID=A0AAD6VUV8_9ROSI|nr:hypothetical protein NC653_018288 [Populus alba x Populus x berolinensis]
MAEGNFVQLVIPRFDGYYNHWAMLMKNFLRSKEYWSLIEIGVPINTTGIEHTEAQQRNAEEMRLKDLKVKNYLFQSIDHTIMETILNRDSAKGIWDSMRQEYQRSTKSHGECMEQIVIIEKILRSMTAKFDYVVCSIEESNNLAEMTINELQSSLLVHEQRMKGHKEEEQVLKVMSEAREDDRFGGRVAISSSREERRVRDVVVGGWSGWSPVSMGGGSGLAKRRRRLGKKEGLSRWREG